MGMFDYVRIECDVPGLPEAQSIEWQTKDFDMPSLDVYHITAEGRLVRDLSRFDEAEGICVPTGEIEDENYHGDLWLHSFDTQTARAIEMVVRFTHGAVEWFRVIRDEIVGPRLTTVSSAPRKG